MLLTDLYMCSPTCPCPLSAQQKYLDLYATGDGKERFAKARRYVEADGAMAGKEGFSKLVF